MFSPYWPPPNDPCGVCWLARYCSPLAAAFSTAGVTRPDAWTARRRLGGATLGSSSFFATSALGGSAALAASFIGASCAKSGRATKQAARPARRGFRMSFVLFRGNLRDLAVVLLELRAERRQLVFPKRL